MGIRIDREAIPFAAASLGAGIALFVLSRLTWSPLAYFCLPLLLLGLGAVVFLRETIHGIAFSPGQIVAPASGRIIKIAEVDEPEFVKGRAIEVSIFMSVFDEHMNYAPVEGEIAYLRYRKGSFRQAFRDQASEMNEAQIIGFEANEQKILMKMVAGIIARRVVFRSRLDAHLKAGENLGLIRFGSRVDLYLPPTAKLEVTKGEAVTGALTVLGRLT